MSTVSSRSNSSFKAGTSPRLPSEISFRQIALASFLVKLRASAAARLTVPLRLPQGLPDFPGRKPLPVTPPCNFPLLSRCKPTSLEGISFSLMVQFPFFTRFNIYGRRRIFRGQKFAQIPANLFNSGMAYVEFETAGSPCRAPLLIRQDCCVL